jgi:hypothetical protein
MGLDGVGQQGCSIGRGYPGPVHDQSKSVGYRMQVDLPYFGITAKDREPMVYPDVAFDAFSYFPPVSSPTR